jgi:hypothetical protein
MLCAASYHFGFGAYFITKSCKKFCLLSVYAFVCTSNVEKRKCICMNVGWLTAATYCSRRYFFFPVSPAKLDRYLSIELFKSSVTLHRQKQNTHLTRASIGVNKVCKHATTVKFCLDFLIC